LCCSGSESHDIVCVIDTSVVIAALLGDITYKRLMECRVTCYTLSYLFSEVAKHWDRLALWKARKLGVTPEDVIERFENRMKAMTAKLRMVPEDRVHLYQDEAFKIIGWRDSGDVPIMALALYLRAELGARVCIISTDDDFEEATKHGFAWKKRPCNVLAREVLYLLGQPPGRDEDAPGSG